LIVKSLTSEWTTLKWLSSRIGVPWRMLIRAMPRLALKGRIEMKMTFVKADKSRKRPRRQYRIRRKDKAVLAVLPDFGKTPDMSSFRVLGVTRHVLEDNDDDEIIQLGYKG
jgi:hypothetical protein